MSELSDAQKVDVVPLYFPRANIEDVRRILDNQEELVNAAIAVLAAVTYAEKHGLRPELHPYSPNAMRLRNAVAGMLGAAKKELP